MKFENKKWDQVSLIDKDEQFPIRMNIFLKTCIQFYDTAKLGISKTSNENV